jgi:ABC-2 type transport system ATP-binding protein
VQLVKAKPSFEGRAQTSPEVEQAARAPGEFALRASKLRKVFGNKVAVRGLTLDVRRGEGFGFLGPNGAGKSTSVKMLLGLVKPTSGTAEVLGCPIGHRETRARVGFLPEHFRFYDWLTAAELVRLHGRLAGVDERVLSKRIPTLLDLVGLSQHGSKQLREFSKGMLQRAGLAQVLINEPEVIFLDEPTSGLDPVGRRLVRDIIKTQRERGATVFLNSHLLGEVEVTCDRVAFIKAGEVIETRNVNEFDEGRTSIAVRAHNVSEEAIRDLHTWASDVHWDGSLLHLKMKAPELAPHVLRYLVESGADVYEFTPLKMSLEDRFLEILGVDHGL